MPRSKRITKSSMHISYQKEFYTDLTAPALLYAKIIRSPASKGYIASVSHPDLPEGYFIFTARDLPGENTIDSPSGKTNIFCDGLISYRGEPVGLLVGPDEHTLGTLLEEVEIVLDDEEHTRTFSKSKALLPGTGENEENRLTASEKTEDFKLATRNIKYGPCFEALENEEEAPGISSVFENCSHVTQGCWTYTPEFPDSSETNGALVTFADGKLTLFTPAQWPSYLRSTITKALEIQAENITIKKTQVTGTNSNSIWYNAIIATQASLACIKTGKSVKLVLSRQEQKSFLGSPRPFTITHKTGIDKDGLIRAMQIDIDVDAGNMNPFAQEILDRLVIASTGCYECENLSITANVFRSHYPPASIDLRMIDCAAFYAVENQIGKICREAKISPIEFRINNFKKSSSAKHRTSFPVKINLDKRDEATLALAKLTDFNRKYITYELDSSSRIKSLLKMQMGETSITPLRGIGIACAYEGAGYMGSSLSDSGMTMELTLEENTQLTIHCPPVSSSVEEIFSKIVGEKLSVPPSSVKINSEFTANEESSSPEIMQSSISILTSLLEKSYDGIKKRKSDTVLPYTVRKKLSTRERSDWNNESLSGTPFYNSAFGAAVVEVEFDQVTYRENIRGIHLVVNAGKLLHTQAAEYSIKKAVSQTLASLVKDDAPGCEKIKISFVQTNAKPTQIGTLVYQMLPAAYTQAVTQALGCVVNSIPLRTDSLYERLLEEKILLLAQEKARLAAEEKARREAEEKTKREAEEKAKREALEKQLKLEMETDKEMLSKEEKTDEVTQ